MTTVAGLSIGDLADQTGVSTSTLRMWETRHGFPVPQRLPSGHRRYDEATVAQVREVQVRRGRGTRLEVAIEQVRAATRASEPSSPSVYAALRRHHQSLPVQRLRKSTLLGLSWAIEDEFCAVAPGSFLFGAFQETRHFESARPRWVELARSTTATYVFADFEEPRSDTRPALVPLAEDHPMRREWAVVADGSDLPVVLSAWELPGQVGVRDSERIFEAVWGFEPDAVRDASRVCATVAAQHGAPLAETVVGALAEPATTRPVDTRAMNSLFNRAVAYIDRSRR